jgi:hypothetical protein
MPTATIKPIHIHVVHPVEASAAGNSHGIARHTSFLTGQEGSCIGWAKRQKPPLRPQLFLSVSGQMLRGCATSKLTCRRRATQPRRRGDLQANARSASLPQISAPGMLRLSARARHFAFSGRSSGGERGTKSAVPMDMSKPIPLSQEVHDHQPHSIGKIKPSSAHEMMRPITSATSRCSRGQARRNGHRARFASWNPARRRSA